jgi:hypothetical protein
MALGDNYATTMELKARLKIPADNTDFEPDLEDALNSASREIERFTNRQYNRVDVATARVFEPYACDYIWITDFWTATDLVIKTDEVGDGTFTRTWTDDMYELYPRNNQEFGVTGYPFYKIFTARGNYFPVYCRGERRGTLQVTAKWGWESVPPQVKTATLALAARNFQMKDAPLGTFSGGSEFGPIRVQDDKFVAAKLQGLRRCGGMRVG